jgi:hypothetical protein
MEYRLVSEEDSCIRFGLLPEADPGAYRHQWSFRGRGLLSGKAAASVTPDLRRRRRVPAGAAQNLELFRLG